MGAKPWTMAYFTARSLLVRPDEALLRLDELYVGRALERGRQRVPLAAAGGRWRGRDQPKQPHLLSLPVAAHPRRSLMLQVFTGVSKVEKAQRNLCQTSPSKNSDNKTNEQIANKK